MRRKDREKKLVMLNYSTAKRCELPDKFKCVNHVVSSITLPREVAHSGVILFSAILCVEIVHDYFMICCHILCTVVALNVKHFQWGSFPCNLQE